MSKKQLTHTNITLDKLVHGGQCLAEAPDGKKLFVWGGLPGELVDVQVTKKKSSYLEGVVCQVHAPSTDRIAPKEPEVYLSSSPWQIMTFESENTAKQTILEEAFVREGVKDNPWQAFYTGAQDYGYRNKVELGFWGDEQGVHYASYIRGTKGKRIITSNALAKSTINHVLPEFLDSLRSYIREHSLRAGDFKTVIFRCSTQGEVVAALFCKKELDFTSFRLPSSIKGLVTYYSNPKSPASVATKQLHIMGDIKLMDTVLDKNITYDVLSFFQVNVSVFETALEDIKSHVYGEQVIDMYAGVGTIGITVGANKLIESDPSNIAMAKQNVTETDIEVIHASSEDTLENITKDTTVIVDPPRAGLHKKLVEHLLEAVPKKIAYLSCNPSTQARDVKLLSDKYKITFARGYNFFPRTPHIESLIVLELK